MKHILCLKIWVVAFLLCSHANAQISIDFPTSRAVFQRNKDNSAIIYISGSYKKAVDRIEAKLIPTNGGSEVNWTTIHSNPQGGFFSGSINARGGWYELQVRGMVGDQQVDFQPVSPIGIGEVIMIAGQSNGQGFNNGAVDYGAQRANDDRVSCIDFNNANLPTAALPYPTFSHLESNTQIAPRGLTAWSWGRLGDLLANRLQVPILFYNVAWEGTLVRTWRESITGRAQSPYASNLYYDPAGMPYGNLKSVLQYYVPITGLRGVLWIQGEGDNQFNTSTDSYANDLKTVIETCRNETGLSNLAWSVSLTSYTNKHQTDSQIIAGQTKVITSVPNVFQGPNTDLIQIPRTDGKEPDGSDGVHLRYEGLTQLAENWNTQLGDQFFNQTEPYIGLAPLTVTASCAGNNSLNLAVNATGLSSLSWNNGANASSIQVGNGTYQVSARDSKGRYIYSPSIQINDAITPSQPQISLQGSNPVCLGNTATLIANNANNVRWNNGATGNQLAVTTGGEYFAIAKNTYGCESTSEKITMTVSTSPLPEKPTIAASGAIVFCDGGEVTLQSNSKVNSVWSNGANTAAVKITTSGEYRVSAVDNLGCYSPQSDPVTVKVNPLPGKPGIALSGPSNFCDGGNVVLTSSYDTGNIWSNASTSKSLTITQTGIFTLKQRDSNGCESNSDPVNIVVNPLPATPSLTALRPTTFCNRDYTTLRSGDAHQYVWSNGAGGQEINVYESGTYTVSARDEIGCTSPPSTAIVVKANPLPETPVIAADGPTTFCENLSVNLKSTNANGFLWSNGGSSQTLKVTVAGVYSVQTINEFQCYSDRSNEIGISTLPLPAAPIIEALGKTTFCDGEFVALKSSSENIVIWNTEVEKDSIHVSESGAFSARVKDSFGCFSPYSAEIKVDVKPTPTAPVIKQIGVFTLIAENNINNGDHVWKWNNTILPNNGITIKATKAGAYVVNNTMVYSSELTCYSDFSAPFNYIPDSNNNGMVAYPNPVTDGKLMVETLEDLTNAEVQVIDSRGVIHKKYPNQKFDERRSFTIGDLNSGIYIIRIVSDTFRASQKLVIIQ